VYIINMITHSGIATLKANVKTRCKNYFEKNEK